MSRAFTFRLKDFTEPILDVVKGLPIKPKVAVLGMLFGGNFLYTVGTKREENILITKKYQFDRNGFTEFMVIDANGNHYNVNNSFWYWKWNSLEDWHRIKTHNTINVQYYGIRFPLLGLFPNIVLIE